MAGKSALNPHNSHEVLLGWIGGSASGRLISGFPSNTAALFKFIIFSDHKSRPTRRRQLASDEIARTVGLPLPSGDFFGQFAVSFSSWEKLGYPALHN